MGFIIMKTIIILGLESSLASPLVAAVDTFRLSGSHYKEIYGESGNHEFSVFIATENGDPVQCANKITIDAHLSFRDLPTHIDLLVIPTVCKKHVKGKIVNQPYLNVIEKIHNLGTPIAVNDFSVPFVAEVGILDNRAATTHWSYIDEFSSQFPLVKLNGQQLMTYDNNIYCCAGGLVWNDLLFEIMSKLSTKELAKKSEKIVMTGRKTQQGMESTSFSFGRYFHEDSTIFEVQHWLEENYSKNICFKEVAKHFNMSQRNFYRRFRYATGETPSEYLKSVRLHMSKDLLQHTNNRIDIVTRLVGYDDTSSFSKLFKKTEGITPKEYRERYNLYPHI